MGSISSTDDPNREADFHSIKAQLETEFPTSKCAHSGSNSNTEDARILEALYATQRMKTCARCSTSHLAFIGVGLAHMPFCVLEESRLGGIPEKFIIIVDYDEAQLNTAKAITELVKALDVSSNHAAVRNMKNEIIDWLLPSPGILTTIHEMVDFEKVQCGNCSSQNDVRMHFHNGSLFVVKSTHESIFQKDIQDILDCAFIKDPGRQFDDLRGTWENNLFDELDQKGVVHLTRLGQFLDYFHFSFGRSVASMFDTSWEFIQRLMGRMDELQQQINQKIFVYLHINLISDVDRFATALHEANIIVSRMNISNIMDYVEGEEEYAKMLELQNLDSHCDCMSTIFIEAYLGGGIKSSLAFEGIYWEEYIDAVKVYDQLVKAQDIGAEYDDLEETYQEQLEELKTLCKDNINPNYVFR